MTISVEISKLKPTNWYLERRKLEAIREAWRKGEESSLPPILITNIDNEITLIDGHCRAYTALVNGASSILASLKKTRETNSNCYLFKNFHRKCVEQGIMTIGDLETRIFDLAEAGKIVATLSNYRDKKPPELNN
jgi:hypothetical protein